MNIMFIVLNNRSMFWLLTNAQLKLVIIVVANGNECILGNNNCLRICQLCLRIMKQSWSGVVYVPIAVCGNVLLMNIIKKLSLLQKKFIFSFYGINFFRFINQNKHGFKTMFLYTMYVSPKLYLKNLMYSCCCILWYLLISIQLNICGLW